MRFQPEGKHILVKRIKPVHIGIIKFPDNYWEKYIYGIVIARGRNVDKSIQNESLLWISWNANIKKLEDDYYIIHEKDVLLVKYKIAWRPLGQRVLIIREHEDTVSSGGIHIPFSASSQTQSMWGVIKTMGTINGELIDHSGFEPGDRVKLTGWDASHIEIGMLDKYCLSVKTKFLACKASNEVV